MKSFFSALFLTVSISIGFAFTEFSTLTCTAPQNVATTLNSGGDISFDWDDCTGSCTEYKVKYVRQGDQYTSSEYTTSVSSFSFTGLTTGTYDFYFYTVCGTQVSPFITIEENILN